MSQYLYVYVDIQNGTSNTTDHARSQNTQTACHWASISLNLKYHQQSQTSQNSATSIADTGCKSTLSNA